MYIFLSHSSKDVEITKRISKIIEKFNVSYFLDGNEILTGTSIPTAIEVGLKKCTHFFIIWSKHAKNSYENAQHSVGIREEIQKINHTKYKNIIKIPIIIDNYQEDLPLGFDGKKYVRISLDNVEKQIMEILRQHGDFETQMEIFRKDIEEDYNHWSSSVDYNPRVRNFKKFDVKNRYTPQNYILSNQNKLSLDVESYIIKRIKRHEDKDIIPVVADYGSGKSSLCNYILYDICVTKNKKLTPIFISLGDLPKKEEGYNDNELINEILKILKKQYKFNLTKQEFLKIIGNGNVLFILDALDEMSYKIENTIAQHNLEQMIEFTKMGKNKILVTSRESYIVGEFREYLLKHENIITLQDFEYEKQVRQFVEKRFSNNRKMIKNVMSLIEHNDKLKKFAVKPLLLNIICDAAERSNGKDIFSEYSLINDAIIFETLTKSWIKHDTSKKEENVTNKEIEEIRLRCSEILAVEEHRQDKPIKQTILESIIHSELTEKNYGEKIDEYLKDARDSTFLSLEGNNSFRFILKPIQEYFLAKAIFRHINELNDVKIKYDIGKGISDVVFKLIIDIAEKYWAISPHVLEIEKENTERLNEYLNRSGNIIEIFKIIQEKDNLQEFMAGPLMSILHSTKNLPKKLDCTNLNLMETLLIGADLREVDFSGANLSGANLSGTDLSNTNLSGANLSGANLSGANVQGENLRKANLSGANLSGIDLRGTDLSGANLSGANLRETDLRGTYLSGANLSGADLRETDLRGIDLSGANLSGADLRGIDLRGIDFKNIDLSGANLSKTDLRGIDLRDMNFENTNFQGADFRKTDLRKTNLEGANLKEVDLRKANLEGVDFSHTNLIGVNLIGMDLRKINRIGTNLWGAKLDKTNFEGVNLQGIDLREALLEGANLRNTNLENANLEGAILKKANLENANLQGINISKVNLEEVNLKNVKNFSKHR